MRKIITIIFILSMTIMAYSDSLILTGGTIYDDCIVTGYKDGKLTLKIKKDNYKGEYEIGIESVKLFTISKIENKINDNIIGTSSINIPQQDKKSQKTATIAKKENYITLDWSEILKDYKGNKNRFLKKTWPKIKGKMVKWDGEIYGIKSGEITVDVDRDGFSEDVALQGLTEDEMLNFNKKENIKFIGRISSWEDRFLVGLILVIKDVKIIK